MNSIVTFYRSLETIVDNSDGYDAYSLIPRSIKLLDYLVSWYVMVFTLLRLTLVQIFY